MRLGAISKVLMVIRAISNVIMMIEAISKVFMRIGAVRLGSVQSYQKGINEDGSIS